MVRTISILLITFLLAGFTVNPELEPDPRGSFVSVFDNKRKRADRYFNNFEYKSAIKLYNKLVEKGKADDLVKLRLAESYLKINDPENAERWYAEVINSPEVTPQHQIQYAHTLLSNGKYEQAREVINSYEFADSDYRSQAIINTLDRLEVFYADSSFYYVNPIDDNKPQYSDFSPTTFKDGMVFVSSRTDKGPKFKWDETPFLDLYYTETDVASAVPFSEKLNSKYHEGPITFYDDYTKAIFTRSNYLDKEFGVNQEGINNLQLYTASWDQEQQDWNDIEPVNFIIPDYSYGHPSITADNNKLYFVSDMPGGFGGTDIYSSERTETGWSDPVNMGELINTAGNEMYPYIDDQNNLYFASNGHGGLGGLDVFQIQLDGPMDLRNMGYPLNTTADDFGFSLNPSGEIAYISSNREGADNIYQIDIQAPDLEVILADNSVHGGTPSLDQEIMPLATSELSDVDEFEDASLLSTINASIIDENNEVLNNADLKLVVDGEEMQSLLSDESGKVSLQVTPDQEYTLIASKEGFEDRVMVLPAESLGQQEDLLIVMNSVFVDSDLPDEMLPTTELDPLAVSGDPWDDGALDQGNRPAVNGVALSDLPNFDEPSESETPTTELDPLAVSGDPWDNGALDQGNRPAVTGVALADLPDFDESSESWDVDNSENTGDNQGETPTTELDPLAVSGDPWDDGALDQSNRPAVNGVALADLPDFDESSESWDVDNSENTGDNQQETPTTELDPLAVSGDPWDDGALDQSDRPAVNGVAFADLPDFEDSSESSAVDNFQAPGEDQLETPSQELDPLAVSGDPWDDGALDQSDRPAVNGVALADLPDFDKSSESSAVDNFQTTGDNQQETPTTELDPLAVSGDPWNDSGLDQGDRPAVNGVALANLPDYDESSESSAVDNFQTTGNNQEERPTTELDPLAVSDDPWNDSDLDQSDRPAVNGAALADLPDFEEPEDLSNTDNLDQSSKGQSEELATNSDPFQFSDRNQLVQARVVDAITGKKLDEADLKLYVDSPNQELNYELKDGVLTFEADPDENYMIVASHDDYQDQYNSLPGKELLTQNDDPLDLALWRIEDVNSGKSSSSGPTKFKVMVKDEETGDQLQDAEVKFFVDGRAIESEYSKDNGKTVFKSQAGDDYMMLVSRKGYQDLIYYLPDAPEDNMDVELAMLREDNTPYSPYRQLAVEGHAFDDFSGSDLDQVTFDVFENGDLIASTDDLSSLEVDPQKDYQILAKKEGYQESLQNITAAQILAGEPVDLPFAMRKLQISEAGGSIAYSDTGADATPVETFIFDMTDDQPISEAVVLVFADNMLQEQANTWETGTVTIHMIPGKDYQLLVKKEGYNDRIITVEDQDSYRNGVEVALIPQDIQRLRPSEIGLTNANMLVMASPDGQEQLYLSTDDNLYKYTVENGNQYLSNDNQKILLQERSRSFDGKRTNKQGSDQFNLRTEDQFLYDELSADEKEMVDKLVEKMQHGDLGQDPDLNVYYHNLPEEYRNLVDYMASNSGLDQGVEEVSLTATTKNLNQILAKNRIAVAEVFNINNIYYDFDKSNIREDAAVELDKLLAILNSNRNIKVVMFSHTDSRGSNRYNDGLSVKRGKAAIQYLVDRGIEMDRLTVQGKGESQLVNSCLDSINCSEEAHQLNRRTEFMLSA